MWRKPGPRGKGGSGFFLDLESLFASSPFIPQNLAPQVSLPLFSLVSQRCETVALGMETGMSQDKRIASAVVAGALVMTGVVFTGCAVRVPSSETSTMNLAGEPATVAQPAASAPAEELSSTD